MNENENATMESVTTDTSTEVDTSTPAESGDTSPADAGGPDTGESAPVVPTYSPNFKFKFAVQNKPTAEEREFDEFIRPVIKDSDTEKKIRDLYEKAYGLDFVKPRFQQAKEELQRVKTEHDGLMGELGGLGKAVQRGDYGMVLEKMGISEENLLRWAAKRVQYLTEMSQEERQRMDSELERERRLTSGDEAMARMQEQYMQTAIDLRHVQMDQTLNHPQVSGVAQAVDAKLGQGAFKQEVIALGAMLSEQYGQDIPVAQAVKAALQKWAPFAANQQPAAAPASTAPKGNPPVIPHMKGSGTSPTRKVLGSLDELKKASMAAQMASVGSGD